MSYWIQKIDCICRSSIVFYASCTRPRVPIVVAETEEVIILRNRDPWKIATSLDCSTGSGIEVPHLEVIKRFTHHRNGRNHPSTELGILFE